MPTIKKFILLLALIVMGLMVFHEKAEASFRPEANSLEEMHKALLKKDLDKRRKALVAPRRILDNIALQNQPTLVATPPLYELGIEGKLPTVLFNSDGQILDHYRNLLQNLEDLGTISASLGSQVEDHALNKIPLNGQQIDLLFRTLKGYLDLSKALTEHSPFNPATGWDVLAHEATVKGSQIFQNYLLWFSGEFTLFEIFVMDFYKYYKVGKVRRLINKENNTYDIDAKAFNNIVRKYLSKEYQEDLQAHLDFITTNIGHVMANNIGKKDLLQLATSVYYKITGDAGSSDIRAEIKQKIKGKFTYLIKGIVDFSTNLKEGFVNLLSKIFGNSVGAVRWRHGYLYHNQEIIEHLEHTLKPFDVIVEKTPFALTDKLIPGMFGHVALWLGTEKQLKDLGLWDSPVVEPYHEFIKEGYVILEALRPGVQLNSLEHFSNIDYIAILRVKDLENAHTNYLEHLYRRSFAQVGKKYDFNFNVETLDKIICSELVYHVFGEVNWPTSTTMGRTTMSPDNVAELLFYENSPLEFVEYIASTDKGRVVFEDIEGLARDIDYAANPEKDGSFLKKVKECKWVDQDNPYLDGPQEREYKCTLELEQRTYESLNDSTYLDFLINGNETTAFKN